MTLRGATRSYKVGPKNNWRRAVWNEVLSRTKGREQTEYILYLGGPQDLDRQIAQNKGVPLDKLIAIDHDRVNVKKIRSEKHSAIQADVLDVLWSWPDDKPVCAVLLDFCSGIEYGNAAVYDAFERKPFRQAIGMVNFMRGRDPWSNSIRDSLGKAGLLVPCWMSSKDHLEPVMAADAKHRGWQFLLYHAWQIFSLAMRLHEEHRNNLIPMIFPEADANSDEQNEFLTMVSLVANSLKPKFFTYRSGALRFDSVVFQSHARHMDNQHIVRQFSELTGMECSDSELHARELKYREPKVSRRLSAMFAVHTRRSQK